MSTITWNQLCNYCHRPIIRGKPTILFATDKPLLVGVSHSTCAATKSNTGHHQMNPPDHLSREEVAFLIQFYPMLYSLPGGFNVPNSDLRRCVAYTLWDYPKSLVNPSDTLRKFRKQYIGLMQPYEGDLEADYLRFLAKVQKAAKENPMDVKFDFL